MAGNGITQGRRAGTARAIDSVDDSGTERLAVDAKFTSGFVASVDLNETDDEVAVFGGVNGSEAADAATRQIINVDSTGHVRVDLARLAGAAISTGGGAEAGSLRVTVANDSTGVLSVDDNGGTLTVDGVDFDIRDWSDTQDSVRIGDGVDLALVTAAGELNVLATAQPSVDIGDVTINNAAGAAAVNIQDGGNSITVDGAVSATQGTTPWTVAGAAADGAAVSGNPVLMGGQDGTNAQAILVDTSGRQQVVGAAANAAAAAGNPVLVAGQSLDGNARTLLSDSSNRLNVVGPQLHDAAWSSASGPMVGGARAVAHGATPTAVADLDVTVLSATRHGLQWVIGGHMNAITRRDNFSAAQTDTALVTVAAGTRIIVTRISVTVDADTTTVPAVRVGFGATNTPTGAGVLVSHPGVPSGGGITVGDGSGVLGIGGDGDDLRLTMDAATSGSVDIVVTYYTAP